MKISYILASLVTAFTLTACGGGGDDGGSTATADPLTILKSSQAVNYPKTYNTATVYASGVVSNTSLSYRWNVERDGAIPVVYGARKAEFDAGFDTIEASLGKTIFDRTTYAGKTVNDVPRNQRVLVVGEYLTPVSAPTCGLATAMWVDQTNSLIPGFPTVWNTDIQGNPVSSSIFPLNAVYVTVNFQPASGCANSADLVVHELAHALGLNGHFDGFGSGAMNTSLVLSVLNKLYSYSPGTPFSSMQ